MYPAAKSPCQRVSHRGGELEECRPEAGWGGAIMRPQSFSGLEKGFLAHYHGGTMP